jgi:hypothetical protein
MGTFWSYYIFIFLVCKSNITSARVTVKNITNVHYNNINLPYSVYSMSDFLLKLLMCLTFWENKGVACIELWHRNFHITYYFYFIWLHVKFLVFRLRVKVWVLLVQKYVTSHKETSAALTVPKEVTSFMNAHCLQGSVTHPNHLTHSNTN